MSAMDPYCLKPGIAAHIHRKSCNWGVLIQEHCKTPCTIARVEFASSLLFYSSLVTQLLMLFSSHQVPEAVLLKLVSWLKFVHSIYQNISFFI